MSLFSFEKVDIEPEQEFFDAKSRKLMFIQIKNLSDNKS